MQLNGRFENVYRASGVRHSSTEGLKICTALLGFVHERRLRVVVDTFDMASAHPVAQCVDKFCVIYLDQTPYFVDVDRADEFLDTNQLTADFLVALTNPSTTEKTAPPQKIQDFLQQSYSCLFAAHTYLLSNACQPRLLVVGGYRPSSGLATCFNIFLFMAVEVIMPE
ncbi:hypothetical protein GALMADRAFT_144684 [Galerina marginata CBS 339.88]|uniref:Uncharacterized protein n=1 Tax=Galerina marginata (strain CBS 339.88) TaxID=685588 RepID=A0A067SHG3_GALM3|nr:hypothetical protein GALMADRAFT_144684 [Galerina marginata CBS 339.88]